MADAGNDAQLEDKLAQLRKQLQEDRKLLRQAAQALAEIDRASGLADHHADVLTALRIRVEGKKRASLDELLTVTEDIAGKRDLGDVLAGGGSTTAEWPAIEEQKRDWPGG